MSASLSGLTVQQIRDKARTDAKMVLDGYWYGTPVPVDPFAIARQLGVGVFSAELGTDAWGMLVGTGSGVDIYLDRDQPTSRFRFSCAHELGHYVDRGQDVADGQAFVDKRSESNVGSVDEIYANEFAASLLMPEPQFSNAVYAGMDNFALANRFDVSLDAVHWRKVHLNLRS